MEHLTEQGLHDGERLQGLWVCQTYEQLVKFFRAGEHWVQRGEESNALFS